MSQGGSFSQGVGQWIGAAEVYDAHGNFAGHGRDTRTVVADHGEGRVTVDVSFEGPFSMAGTYTIADKTTHRLYEGPVNYGFAEVLGDGLVAAHNYWHDHGLNQRFFLMVMPGGMRQVSLAVLTRGERLAWTVVGEYQRQLDPDDPQPPAVQDIDVQAVNGDPNAGRPVNLLQRAGCWTGELTVLDAALANPATAAYTETVEQASDGLTYQIQGTTFGGDETYRCHTDGWSQWTPPGAVVGSASITGGRGLSAHYLYPSLGLRVWRREVVTLDGTTKGVVHLWYRGEERIGAAYGVLSFVE